MLVSSTDILLPLSGRHQSEDVTNVRLQSRVIRRRQQTISSEPARAKQTPLKHAVYKDMFERERERDTAEARQEKWTTLY